MSKVSDTQVVSGPKQKRSQETRNKIVAAAYKLISSNGFNATTSHQIAAEAGISVGTFYIYFRNKQVLLHEIATLYQEQFQSDRSAVISELRTQKLSFSEFIKKLLVRQALLHKETWAFNQELKALYYTDSVIAGLSDKRREQISLSIIEYLDSYPEMLPQVDKRQFAFLVERVFDAAIDRLSLCKDEQESESIITAVLALMTLPSSHVHVC
jgi:AcrR family transcriptional regulator